MSDIKAIVQVGEHSLAVFKKKEDAYAFENYLTAIGVVLLTQTSTNSKVKSLTQFGNSLGNRSKVLTSEGYLYIFARYVYTQIIEDFIKLMED